MRWEASQEEGELKLNVMSKKLERQSMLCEAGDSDCGFFFVRFVYLAGTDTRLHFSRPRIAG
jgi:hypothetical protein